MPSLPKLQRATRMFIVASTVLAGIAHGWLVVWQPYVVPAAVAAFVISFLLARASLIAALLPALFTVYVAPALLYLSVGISDYHLTLVWLALFAGPVLAHTRLEQWHLPQPWALLFAAWALVIAATWPIVAGREIDFSLLAARTLDSHTAMFEGAPPMAAAWVVITAFGQMLGVLWIDLLWARFGQGDALLPFERGIVVPILLSAVVGGLATIYQGAIDLQWVNVEFWSHLGRAGGLMLDANTAGIAGAIWAPVAILLVWRHRLPPWAAVLAYVVLAAAAWESGSRTALVALAAGTAGVLVGAAQRKGWWQPRMAPIVLLIAAAVVVLAMFVAPRGGNSPSPLQRVFDRLPRPEAEDLARFGREIWTRFGYGTAADRIIAEHPIGGVGIGAFHVVFNDFLHRDTGRTLPPDNAQNWWRHQVAELGVVGALPSLTLSAVLLALLWRGGRYVKPVGSTTVLRCVLAGVGLASVLGVPAQHPSTWIAFATILFWLLALYDSAGTPSRASIGGGAYAAAVLLAAITAAALAVSARGHLRVPVRALWTGAPFAYGVQYEGISEYGELRWVASHAVQVVERQTAWLRMVLWAPHRDVAEVPVAVRVDLNDRRAIERTIDSREPVVYFLQVGDVHPWAMIETHVSRDVTPGHALQAATEWLPALPPDAQPAQIIR